MLKTLKYLKESAIVVLAIIVLLFIEAMADLELPAYTSKIVNVGIQQAGIENVSPEKITKTDMEKVLLFTDKDEEILQSYTINNDIYEVKRLSKDEQNRLNGLMQNPIVALSIFTNKETEQQIKAKMFANAPKEQMQYLQELELVDIVKSIPEAERGQILQEVDIQIQSMEGTIVEQAAIQEVKVLYKNAGIDINNYQVKYIVISGLKMLGVATISIIAGVVILFLSSRVAAKLGKTLREKVFKKVLSFSNKEYKEFSTASLITRNTNDVQQIQNLITMLFRVVFYAPIVAIGGILKVMSSNNQSMTWIIGVAVLAVMSIIMVLFVVAMPKFKKLQDLVDRLNLVSREILTGLPVIRAFNREKVEEKRFDNANFDLMKTNLFINRTMSIMMPTIMFIMNAITVLIIWKGSMYVDEGLLQVGDLMAFIQYTFQIVFSFLMISMISIMLPRAVVSAKRINEVIETESCIKDIENPIDLSGKIKGVLEFKDVTFRYPDADEDMLTNISFVANPGETTAIIGSTGSGKSTIVNLIPRFYDVTKGEILLDGVNIKQISQKELRDTIGFVPQKGVLFSGTIESNIKYGKPNIPDEKMIEAAQIAQATEFIDSKEEKYKSEISQGGNNVSGGQRQRISIARAIAKQPSIFVFDDSFSALDYKTDAKLREALKNKTENKTVIIVAQRISTVLDAQQIIVLEEGKIVGKGTHKELMENNEVYKQIALSQLSEEELS